MPSTALTLDEFFEGQAEARRVFEAVRTLIEALGPVAVRVTKSQVAFRRRKAFAWAWRPEQYLRRRAAPLVLSVALMGLASTFVARIINKYRWIAYVGVAIILYVALKMMWDGYKELNHVEEEPAAAVQVEEAVQGEGAAEGAAEVPASE